MSQMGRLAEGSSLAANILFAGLRALARSAVHIIVRHYKLCRCRSLTAQPEPTVTSSTSDGGSTSLTRSGGPVR
jgi:hypothetical protein